MSAAPLVLSGEGRLAQPGALAQPCRLVLDVAQFELTIGKAAPMIAAYRDIETLAVQSGTVLLALGSGPSPTRVILERFGSQTGAVIAGLRDRRARQHLADAFVDIPTEQNLELVEYRVGQEHGVAQLAIGAWGAELLPLDERLPWRRIRRAEIVEAAADPAAGEVRVTLGEPLEGSRGEPRAPLQVLGLGAGAQRVAATFAELRDAAVRDAAALVAGLVPDAGFATRQGLTRLLVDGRPAGRDALVEWAGLIDGAVLSEPVFAQSLHALVERAGPDAPRWFAMAPERPGAQERRAWYLVGLPGNLLALELVSAGAHATYLFRIVARATYDGADAAGLGSSTEAAARAVSAALIDARYLREPIALPEELLANARYLRYRMALAALPTLAAARARFVARLVHDDPARWASALDDLVRWHAACRDDAAIWPGRGVEEAAVAAADGGAELADQAEPAGAT